MGPRDKLLAEWWWTDRWNGSSGFLLPMEPRGLYREMLTQAWRRGARLPNDHEAIQRATGCTQAEWDRCWPRVSRFWRVEGDSMVNDTQLEVYRHCESLRETRSKGGSKGGSKTQANRVANPVARGVANPQAKLNPPSPSLDPSLTLTPNERTNGAPANPLVQGRRVELEREALALVGEIATATDRDPAEVMAEASKYPGNPNQRTKLNPASMTDDRLLATVLDLRATATAARKARPSVLRAVGGDA